MALSPAIGSVRAEPTIISRAVSVRGLLCRCLDLGWFERGRDSRKLRLTPDGKTGLADVFGVVLDGSVDASPRRDAGFRLIA